MSRAGILATLLTSFAVALAALARWSATSDVLAAEAPAVPLPAALRAGPEPRPLALPEPLPEPELAVRVAVVDPVRARFDAVASRRKRWTPEFEETYRGWSAVELRGRITELESLRSEAVTARFEELHARFEEHLRDGEYGARVIPIGKGSPFPPAGPRSSSHRSARPVVTERGYEVYHLLEFDPASDDVTARLWAELDWVHAQADAR